jgi:hypothetical protein
LVNFLSKASLLLSFRVERLYSQLQNFVVHSQEESLRLLTTNIKAFTVDS